MPQATLDYYAVLHVSPEAPAEVIKASYRALSRKYHPDQNGGSSKFERKMQELNEAYGVLGDPDLREDYDDTRYDDDQGEDEDEASSQEETPQLIKACPNCGTKNRLLQGATNPNCGKCGSSLSEQSSENFDYESAITSLEEQQEYGQLADAYLAWGQALAGDKHYERACGVLGKGLRATGSELIRQELRKVTMSRASHFEADGDFEQAIDILQDYAEKYEEHELVEPSIIQYYQDWARLLSEEGQAAAAQDVEARLANEYPHVQGSQETYYDDEEDDEYEASSQEETPHLIKACPNCGTKNRLLQGAINPNCGKCGCSLDQQSSELPDFLGGRFQVVRLLGAGGFGQVFLCNDNRLGRQVAVKVLKDIESPASLRREATTLSNLSHPGLAKLFDYLEQDNKGVLVSEYVKGATLAQLTTPQAEADVLKWALALTDILDYIHNVSPPVIHRDIKPSNIIIDNHGNLRLLDFGISKKTVENGATSTTALGGTPGYAPPEQYAARSGQTDAQSDLYSLGATLFWAITATHPPDAIERLQDDDALVFRRSRCSASLQDIVRDLMKLKKQARPASAASLKARLNKPEPIFEKAEQPNGTFSDRPKPNTNYGYDLGLENFMEPNEPTPISYCFKREQSQRPVWVRMLFFRDDTTDNERRMEIYISLLLAIAISGVMVALRWFNKL